MSTYAPPVDKLVTLGEPTFGDIDADYADHGIGPEHVPELIRLLQDGELASGSGNTPEVYAQVHAWRALGQLRAPAAIEPLFDLLEKNSGLDADDWISDEVPRVLGMFGPSAIPLATARLEQRKSKEFAGIEFVSVLGEIGKQHPAARAEVVTRLCQALATAATNDPSVNGFIIGDLLALAATEAWPDIERAFATGNVDESVAGDRDDVKYDLGLGPKPPPRNYFQTAKPKPTNAKQRFNERQRQKKLEKKKNKKKRK